MKQMVFSRFKKADDLHIQGMDLIRQGEFAKARERLLLSIRKDGGPDDLSAVVVGMIDLRGNMGDVGAYRNLITSLKNTDAKEFEFGLTMVNTETMIKQSELAIEEIRITNMRGSGRDLVDKGQKLVELAQRYQTEVGEETLKLSEIYNNDTTRTGMKEGAMLMAMGYEAYATGTVWEDPRKAAEYQQIAYGYRKQMGDTGEENLRLINDYAKTCKCWYCGRVVSGLGIHFFALPSDISPALRTPPGREPLTSETEDHEAIYACRACHSSITKKADEIAQRYHENAMSEIRATEARMQAELYAIHSQLSYLRR